MDRKSLLILALCFGLLMLWPRLIAHFYPPPPPSTNVVSSATNPLPGSTNPVTGQANQSYRFTGTNAVAPFVVSNEIPEQKIVVTNDLARYIFTSRGGGLQEVELTKYPESVSSRRRKQTETNAFATLNTPAAPPVLAILGSGNETLQGDGNFKLTQTKDGVHAEKTLTNGLTLVKDFQIGTNYLVSASVKLENRSQQPILLPEQKWIVGTATPMGPQDTGVGTVSVQWYDGVKVDSVNLSYFDTNTTKFFFFPRTPLTEYRAGNSNVVWVAPQNQFFTLATMPKAPAPALTVRMVDLPPPNQEEINSNPHTVKAPKGLLTALDYPGQTLAPGQVVEQSFNLFAGPKEYHTLARISERFHNNLELIMGFNGFIGNFAKGLLTALNWFHTKLLLPYGWAIVCITVLIKLIFWPLTQYSTKSMKRMQALQPQMKAMQEKYKDDPQKLSQKQMEFWRKNKVNPLSGCLPMLLQLPLLWGFYRMLQSAIELRGAQFLWVGDLSKPDTIFVIPGFNFPVNPMPLIMGATMLWQSHLTPPSPGMDPAQQKMMRYMPLIFLFILYNYSSGLALYWTVQNLLSILQTKMIRSSDVTPAAAQPAASVAPQKKKK
jgi:YidC/Oxa1 family membrane protein insertase